MRAWNSVASSHYLLSFFDIAHTFIVRGIFYEVLVVYFYFTCVVGDYGPSLVATLSLSKYFVADQPYFR